MFSHIGDSYQEGLAPIHLVIETDFHRASPGGTGGVKTIGNYAAVKLLYFLLCRFWLAYRIFLWSCWILYGCMIPWSLLYGDWSIIPLRRALLCFCCFCSQMCLICLLASNNFSGMSTCWAIRMALGSIFFRLLHIEYHFYFMIVFPIISSLYLV